MNRHSIVRGGAVLLEAHFRGGVQWSKGRLVMVLVIEFEFVCRDMCLQATSFEIVPTV